MAGTPSPPGPRACGATIDVAVATRGLEGLRRVAASGWWPEVDGVRYVVSWQDSQGAPVPEALACRDDVEVHRLDTPGLSANRNNALSHCRADIVMPSDDDICYRPAHFARVRRALGEHPDIDYALFRYGSAWGKSYPAEGYAVGRHLARGHHACTYEMALRRRALLERGVAYDLRFGPGAPLACGEDPLLELTMRRLGMKGRYFPQEICVNTSLPTGLRRIADPAVIRAMGALIVWEWRGSWPLRTPLKGWRLWRTGQAPAGQALLHIWAGALWAVCHRPPWRGRGRKE